MRNGQATTILLFVLAMIIVMLLYAGTARPITYRETEYVVKSGDTLWQIAAMYCHPKADKRDWIADVVSANNITGWIQPGDRLTVMEWVK